MVRCARSGIRSLPRSSRSTTRSPSTSTRTQTGRSVTIPVWSPPPACSGWAAGVALGGAATGGLAVGWAIVCEGGETGAPSDASRRFSRNTAATTTNAIAASPAISVGKPSRLTRGRTTGSGTPIGGSAAVSAGSGSGAATISGSGGGAARTGGVAGGKGAAAVGVGTGTDATVAGSLVSRSGAGFLNERTNASNSSTVCPR
jgi:hypothetical protein